MALYFCNAFFVVAVNSFCSLTNYFQIPLLFFPHSWYWHQPILEYNIQLMWCLICNHLILCHPLLLLPSTFPNIGSFPMSWTHWTWIWANSLRQWRTGEPGVLQSMGSQRVGHDLVTEQQYSIDVVFKVQEFSIFNKL